MAEDQLDSIISSLAARSESSQNAEAGPSKAPRKEVTLEEFQKVLDSTPLFMKETPADSEDNYVLEALRSLVFEGEDIALNFKNHGNELYAQKSYKDAIKAYSEGLEAGPKDIDLRITLLSNRAACNLALKNFGSTLKDASVIIALCTQEGKVVPKKALFRAAQALVGLERWTEARDVVQRGKVGNEAEWKDVEAKVEKGLQGGRERGERLRRERLGKRALKEAIESRGLIVVDTPSPPDNPHPLHLDPDSLPALPLSDFSWTPPPAVTPLVYPVFLLYPTHSQSDLITHFHETTSLNDQLAAMFPSSKSGDQSRPNDGWAEWDEKHQYHVGNLVVYVETRHQRLLKCGKDLPLVEVLAKGAKIEGGKVVDGVILRDGLLSFVVLPKGQDEKKWIDEYKQKRDGN